MKTVSLEEYTNIVRSFIHDISDFLDKKILSSLEKEIENEPGLAYKLKFSIFQILLLDVYRSVICDSVEDSKESIIAAANFNHEMCLKAIESAAEARAEARAENEKKELLRKEKRHGRRQEENDSPKTH